MKNFRTVVKSLLVIILLASNFAANAQSCTYLLRLYDENFLSYGWDDSQLYVKIGNNPERAFTHNGAGQRPADSLRLYNLTVNVGDSINVRYEPQGDYQKEIKFALFNNAGETVISQGPTPQSGVIYKGVAKCVTCGGPLNATVASIRTFTATISWNPSTTGTRQKYQVEWGTANFKPGTSPNVIVTPDTFAILPSLTEVTRYFVYLKTLCSGGAADTSSWVGPLSFRTDTATNVGVSAILSPDTRCDLANELVKIKIKNFGGAPQSLIDYAYSVNGVNAPVNYPSDGFYTDVISKDSTATVTFKTPYNFSAEGEYKIAAWTSFDKKYGVDKNTKNDTFRITIVHPRLINQFPYQQDFEGGRDTWTVTDTVGNSTWAWANPNYRFIRGSATGVRCWTTGPDTSYKANDTSFLVSPCFDFSSFGVDPRVTFALNFYTEANFDGAWLEGSTDGGKKWFRIGSRGTGINWYNDTIFRKNVDVWTGTTRRGWRNAQNTLTGMAGKPNCRLRFVFRSDDAGFGSADAAYDGVAIDNFIVSNPQPIDMAGDGVSKSDVSDCGSLTDNVSLRIANLGTTPQSNFSVSYRLDDNPSVAETTTLTIAPNQTAVYRFTTPLNTFVGEGTHILRAWVNTTGDNTKVNDTTYTNFVIAPSVRGNTVFNFNDGAAPQYWTGTRAGLARGNHGNDSLNGYIFTNLYADTAGLEPGVDTRFFNVTTNKFGPIRAEDSLKYDYRFVGEDAPFGAYNLVNKDTLKVQAAFDCTNVWTNIDTVSSKNHVLSNKYATRSLSLKNFVGRLVKFRFELTSKIPTYTGYYFDLDNVNYKSACPAKLNLQVNIKDANIGQSNGQITVTPTGGRSPYKYLWSNNTTANSIANLAPGLYSVTVNDANGCSDVTEFRVNLFTATFDLNSTISRVTLSPNPTSENAILDVEFRKITDAQVQVMNIMGQVVEQFQSKQTDKAQFDLDMSNRPAGIYIIRITADNKTHIAKLVKQ